MIKRVLINALALGVATFALYGRGITLDTTDRVREVLTILGVAVIFGVVNALVKPIFKVLTGCLIMISLGLFLLVINAAMVMVTSWACGRLGLSWHVDAFWPTAVIVTVIVSVVNFLVIKFLPSKKR